MGSRAKDREQRKESVNWKTEQGKSPTLNDRQKIEIK